MLTPPAEPAREPGPAHLLTSEHVANLLHNMESPGYTPQDARWLAHYLRCALLTVRDIERRADTGLREMRESLLDRSERWREVGQ